MSEKSSSSEKDVSATGSAEKGTVATETESGPPSAKQPATSGVTLETSKLRQILGDTFIRKNGQKVTVEDLEKCTNIAVYISAHWCGPCKKFTPVLRQRYTEIREDKGLDFEVVFVSCDRSAAEFESYFSEMGNWCAVPFSESKRRDRITKELNKKGYIPHLCMLAPTGEVLTQNGRQAIEQDKSAYMYPWKAFENKYQPPSLFRRLILRIVVFAIAFVVMYYMNVKQGASIKQGLHEKYHM